MVVDPLHAMALCLPRATWAAPPAHSDLIGCDLDAVRDRFGPPLTLTDDGSTMTLSYLDRQGTVIEHAVVVIDEVVVRVAPDLIANAADGRVDDVLGATIGEAIATLGAALDIRLEQSSQTVTFAGCCTTVTAGRVVAVRKS